jgi:hypothetical protein
LVRFGGHFPGSRHHQGRPAKNAAKQTKASASRWQYSTSAALSSVRRSAEVSEEYSQHPTGCVG